MPHRINWRKFFPVGMDQRHHILRYRIDYGHSRRKTPGHGWRFASRAILHTRTREVERHGDVLDEEFAFFNTILGLEGRNWCLELDPKTPESRVSSKKSLFTSLYTLCKRARDRLTPIPILTSFP